MFYVKSTPITFHFCHILSFSDYCICSMYDIRVSNVLLLLTDFYFPVSLRPKWQPLSQKLHIIDALVQYCKMLKRIALSLLKKQSLSADLHCRAKEIEGKGLVQSVMEGAKIIGYLYQYDVALRAGLTVWMWKSSVSGS